MRSIETDLLVVLLIKRPGTMCYHDEEEPSCVFTDAGLGYLYLFF